MADQPTLSDLELSIYRQLAERLARDQRLNSPFVILYQLLCELPSEYTPVIHKLTEAIQTRDLMLMRYALSLGAKLRPELTEIISALERLGHNNKDEWDS